MLRFYRQSKLIWFTLIALSLFWLLPLIHAAQLATQANTVAQATLCSSIGAAAPQKSEAPATPAPHAKQCPICITSSNKHWALPTAPAVLPSIHLYTRLLRLVGSEGFFIPAALYTLPQSQAPPLA